MVDRKFNRPVCKIMRVPLFWLKEMPRAEWDCHRCRNRMQKGNVCFEATVRFASKIDENKWIEKPIKHYFCLDCALILLDEAKEKVSLVKNLGTEAFKLMEEL